MPETLKRLSVVVSICVAIGASAFALGNSIIAKNASVCVSENADNRTLSNLLIYFEGQTLRSPHLTARQRQEATNFYQQSLKQIPSQKRC